MGSSGTSLARSAVAHGVRRSALLERIASGGRSQETGWLSMSGKVGSRLFPSGDSRDLAMSARKWFRRLPWWKSGRLAIQGGSRNPDSLSGSAGRKRTPSYTTCTVLETAIANEGWPLIYTILAGSVGVAETA